MEINNDILLFAEWISNNSYKLCANGKLGNGLYNTIANNTNELYQIYIYQNKNGV